MSEQPETDHKNRGLWITVIVEAIIYEIRRSSELVQKKIQGLADFSARQGEKLDRMTTALEIYVGKKFSATNLTGTNTATADQRIDKAIEFLEAWKKKKEPDALTNGSVTAEQ